MNPKVPEVIVASTKKLFSSMAGLSVVAETPYLNGAMTDPLDFTGIMGISGKVTGAVGVHLSKKIVSRVAGVMLGMDVPEDSPDLSGVAGEMTNLIVGSMRNDLNAIGVEFEISIPTVVSGASYITSIQSDVPSLLIPFTSEGARFVVESRMKSA